MPQVEAEVKGGRLKPESKATGQSRSNGGNNSVYVRSKAVVEVKGCCRCRRLLLGPFNLIKVKVRCSGRSQSCRADREVGVEGMRAMSPIEVANEESATGQP